MAEYAGSIDDEVQRKVDAYRSNPGALKQRYQMNQDLLDLLALQRINKEMQEKKRDIEMSMQQNPQTIKQQREAEVLGMTKDDVGRQVGGIMAQRQAAQQQNLRNVAAGQRPATRMPMNPQMAGIASQPAPNMARMAQGGVVTFAAGDPVEGENEEDRRKREATEILASVGVTPERFADASPEDKARIREAINEKRYLTTLASSMAQPVAALYDVANVPLKVGADMVGTFSRATGLMDPADRFGLEKRGLTPAMDVLRRNSLPPVDMSQLVPPAPPANPAGQTGLGDSPLLNLPPRRDVVPDYLKPGPTPVAPNMQALQSQVGARPGLASRDITPTDAEGLAALRGQIDAQRQATLGRDKTAEMRQAGTLSREIAGQEGVMKLLKEAQDRRAALVKEQEAARGPWDWTARLPGGGGFGDINRAMSSQRAANEAAALGNLDQEIKLIQDQSKELGLFGRDAFTSARAAGSEVEAAQKQAAESLAMQYGADSKAADARADRIFSASVTELESYDKAVRRVTDIALAQYEGEYAERAKKIGASASLLAAEIAAESDEKTRRAMALVNIAKLQAEVRSNAEASIANTANPLADPGFQKLSPEDKAKKIKARRDAADREAEGYRQLIEAAFAARPRLPIRQETSGE